MYDVTEDTKKQNIINKSIFSPPAQLLQGLHHQYFGASEELSERQRFLEGGDGEAERGEEFWAPSSDVLSISCRIDTPNIAI